MSEVNFYPTSGNKLRGSKYPTFAGGATNADGNVDTVSQVANPQSLQVATPTPVAPLQTAATSPLAQQTFETPTEAVAVPEAPSLGGMVAGAVVPYAASTIGSSVGSSLATGGTFGAGISEGISKIGERAGSLLGDSAGSTLGDSAAGASVNTFDGMGGGLFKANSAGSEAASGAGIGGAVGAGLGTAAVGLLTGQKPGKALLSGAASGLGFYAGNAILPGIGGIIGGTIAAPVIKVVTKFFKKIFKRVVCTELVRQGYMTPEDLRIDVFYTWQALSSTHVRGYHAWAFPYAKLMKRKDWVGRAATHLIKPFVIARCNAIKYRLGITNKFTLFGELSKFVLEEMSYVIGVFLPETEDSIIYRKAGT